MRLKAKETRRGYPVMVKTSVEEEQYEGVTRGLGLTSSLRMISQGSITGSQAATTGLKDQMELRKPM